MKKSINSKEHKKLLEHLIQLRLNAGVTQVELSKKLKVHQSFVSKYETGERRLDLIELKQICTVLGISLKEFVDGFEKELR
ncbi:MAG TPA: helix-turn-helix transcriptional regulator [Cytophagaceae bacterium]|nr:helix-turn-helix transcriptional regulator [Cytophagaceae bacterium]